MKIQDLLKVKSEISDLIRLGPNVDGGYVINKTALELSDVLYSYGIGHEYNFELQYSNMFENKTVKMFDHTVDVFLDSLNVKFFKEKLDVISENKTTFENHLTLNDDLEKNIFLKIDVEGFEYSFFKNLESTILKNVVGLAVEFHHLNSSFQKNEFISIISNLTKYYDITHIHGNNCCGLFNLEEDFKFPTHPEISFIRKDINGCKEYTKRNFPLAGLDFPNRPLPWGEDLYFSV